MKVIVEALSKKILRFNSIPGNFPRFRILFLFILIGFGTMSDSVCKPEFESQNQNMYYRSVDGDDSVDGSFNSPLAAVERALTETGPGDTVFLRGGTYKINRPVQLGAARRKRALGNHKILSR